MKTRTVWPMFFSLCEPMSTNDRSVLPVRYSCIHLEIAMPPGGEQP